MLTAEEFAELVHDVAQRHAIPGLSAAFDRGGEVHRAASGVLNVTTQAGVGDDAEFALREILPVQIEVDCIYPRQKRSARRIADATAEACVIACALDRLDIIHAA